MTFGLGAKTLARAERGVAERRAFRCGAALAVLPLCIGLTSGALADEAVTSSPQAVSLGKALAFETASSALEAGLFVAFFGGGAAAAAPVMALSFSTSLGVYILNDYAWSQTAPEPPGEENWRVIEKAATYRALTLARSYGIASVMGGAKAATPLAFAAAYNLADTLLYIGVEKVHAAVQAQP